MPELPGQGWMLHGRRCLKAPLQVLWPNGWAGLIHLRILDWIPSPHDLLHLLYSPQGVHVPSDRTKAAAACDPKSPWEIGKTLWTAIAKRWNGYHMLSFYYTITLYATSREHFWSWNWNRHFSFTFFGNIWQVSQGFQHIKTPSMTYLKPKTYFNCYHSTISEIQVMEGSLWSVLRTSTWTCHELVAILLFYCRPWTSMSAK